MRTARRAGIVSERRRFGRNLVHLLFGPFVFSFVFNLLKSQTFSRRKLAKPNPTTYVFHSPIVQVRAAIRDAAGTYPCPPHPTLCLVIYRPSNGTEYDLDQLEWTKSDVYDWLGKRLEYKAEEYRILLMIGDKLGEQGMPLLQVPR